VATTIAEDIVAQQLLSLEVLFAGLLGAIMWNLATWATDAEVAGENARSVCTLPRR
jgi:phosphate/sulfate permease